MGSDELHHFFDNDRGLLPSRIVHPRPVHRQSAKLGKRSVRLLFCFNCIVIGHHLGVPRGFLRLGGSLRLIGERWLSRIWWRGLALSESRAAKQSRNDKALHSSPGSLGIQACGTPRFSARSCTLPYWPRRRSRSFQRSSSARLSAALRKLSAVEA